MDGEDFRKHATDLVNYMINYKDNNRKGLIEVGPQHRLLDTQYPTMHKLIPDAAPTEGENFTEVMKDVNLLIAPRLLNWAHPHFFAYFPNGNSYPTILADMLSDVWANVGFSWASSPATTELEMVMMDWYGQVLNAPKQFLFKTNGGRGGGVLQCSASDTMFVSPVAARYRALKFLKKQYPDKDEYELINKLVGYTSKETHSCAQKGYILAMCRHRILTPNKNNELTGEILEKAMIEDEKKGLIPFMVICCIGTTGTTAVDRVMEIGAVCKRRPLVWLHVDCAYAGSSFMCEEFEYLTWGLDYADSWNVNANKWMTVAYDCSGHWLKDRFQFTEGLVVTPTYLKNAIPGIIDYRHWQVQLSRRIRSLKLYFLFRVCGVNHLKETIRNHVKLAKYFETLVRNDSRFEVTNIVLFSCVAIRLKGPDVLTQHLVAVLNAAGKLHVTPTKDQGRYVMRIVVTYEFATKEHVDYAWKHILEAAETTLQIVAKYPNLMPSKRLSSSYPVDKETLNLIEANTRDLSDPIPMLQY